MDKDNLEQKAIELLQEAYKLSHEDNPDALAMDRLDLELSSLNSSIGQLYKKAEFEAGKWKQYNSDIKEVVRSLRKVHETLNTERRMN